MMSNLDLLFASDEQTQIGMHLSKDELTFDDIRVLSKILEQLA